MQEMILHIMDSYGYFGLCALIALENLLPPIPSEAILPFAGFMTSYTRMTVLGAVVFSTIGSCIGAIILYGIGTMFVPQNFEKVFADHRVKRLGFQCSDVEKTLKWFEKCGKKSILLGRCIPVIRSLISIPAGMAKVRFSIFCVYTMIGSAIWNTLLIVCGVILGSSWEKVVIFVGKYALVIQIGLFVFASVYLMRFIKKIRKRKHE